MEQLSIVYEDYLNNHRALGRSQETINRHAASHRLLLRFLEERGQAATTAALSTETMRLFARWLHESPLERPQRGKTTRTTHGIRGPLKDMRALSAWLVDEERLDKAPKIPMPSLPDTLFPILSDEEVDSVWNCKYLAGSSSIATRNRALIGLMLDTGLRRAEVASLTLGMLDLENCLVTVTGKGKKQRRVPFSTAVQRLLEEWIAIRGTEDDEPLFWLKPAGIRQVFRSIQLHLGLTRFHPHMCRHQAATALVRNNADLESVRRILGHADIATTVQYLSMNDEDIRTKHAAASPFNSLIRAKEPERQQRRKRLSLHD